MVEFYAKDYGILPNVDVASGLDRLFEVVKNIEDEKTIVFEEGTYYIDTKNSKKHKFYVTNTVGNNEYDSSDERHTVPVAFYIENVKNLVIDGNNSTFIINGKCTNMAFINCENICVRNFEILASNPDIHELKVISKNKHYVDFLVDQNTKIKSEKNKIYFIGEDYKVPVNKNAKTSWWNAYIDAKKPNTVVRYRHPFADAFKLVCNGDNIIRAYMFNASKFNVDDRFYIYNARRDYVGIFTDKCKNFELKNIKQRISCSLALVCQDTENILVDRIEFAPKNSDQFKMSSVADFIQICMCRGDVTVKNSYFDGAGDDLLNCHGVHFEIEKRNGNKLTVAFKHPQTHGYNPLRIGDKIAYIDKNTLLEKGRSEITSSKLINEDEIEITLNSIGNFNIGDCIEDISACPDLTFKNNKSTRIITRGILVTTRGKVVIENNEFLSTSMSGILLSDDAKSWYESGMCEDVLIKNNVFDYCAQTPILIKPENIKHEGPVHKNIKIIGNVFKNYNNECIFAKSTNDILVEDNEFANPNYLKTTNCDNVSVKYNKVRF